MSEYIEAQVKLFNKSYAQNLYNSFSTIITLANWIKIIEQPLYNCVTIKTIKADYSAIYFGALTYYTVKVCHFNKTLSVRQI